MVRAYEGTFTDEFLNAGFELVDRRDDMFPENYLLKFAIRAPAAACSSGRNNLTARSWRAEEITCQPGSWRAEENKSCQPGWRAQEIIELPKHERGAA